MLKKLEGCFMTRNDIKIRCCGVALAPRIIRLIDVLKWIVNHSFLLPMVLLVVVGTCQGLLLHHFSAVEW